MTPPTKWEITNAYEGAISVYAPDDAVGYLGPSTVAFASERDMLALLDAEMDLVALVPRRLVNTETKERLPMLLARVLNAAEGWAPHETVRKTACSRTNPGLVVAKLRAGSELVIPVNRECTACRQPWDPSHMLVIYDEAP